MNDTEQVESAEADDIAASLRYQRHTRRVGQACKPSRHGGDVSRISKLPK